MDAFFAADRKGYYRNVRAVVVSVDGSVVFEKYTHGSATTTWNIQTMGPAIVATLIGMARDEGKLTGLNDPLSKLLPEYTSEMSAEAKQITLKELLMMTSGLPGSDTYYPLVWDTNQDWIARLLRDGPIQTPGLAFDLTQATTGDLLVAILEHATRRSVVDYARQKLFTPLGITTTPVYEAPLASKNQAAYDAAGFAWPTDPRGHHLGVSMKLTGRDMAKIGQLWLDKGRWQGHQLVSADWITQSQSALEEIGTENDGAPIGFGYGLFSAKITGHSVFAPVGVGGQLAEVVPDLGMVVVVLTQSRLNPTAPSDAGTTNDGSDYDALVSAIEPAVH